MGACCSTKNMHEIDCNYKNINDKPEILPEPRKDCRKHDLMNGYCRKLECQKIIPIEIIHLCSTFYGDHYSKKIFFGLPGIIDSSIEIAMFDMNSEQVCYLKHNQFSNDIISTSGPFCYIPHINPNKGLDAILCVNKQCIHIPYWNNIPTLTPTLLLFDSNHLNAKSMDNNNMKYCKIEFCETEKPQQFIYCGRKNGIVCIKYGCLYRVQLPINLDFMDIVCIKYGYKFRLFSDEIFWKRYDELNMCYLPDKQQIFAIKHENKDISGHYDTKCGIFDFNVNKWKYVKRLRAKTIYEFEEFRLCYDGEKIVYGVSNKGQVIGYDVNLDEWIVFMKENYFKPMKQFMIWIEQNGRNNIYCTDGILLRYFDTKSKVWKRKKRYTEILDKLDNKSVVFG